MLLLDRVTHHIPRHSRGVPTNTPNHSGGLFLPTDRHSLYNTSESYPVLVELNFRSCEVLGNQTSGKLVPVKYAIVTDAILDFRGHKN